MARFTGTIGADNFVGPNGEDNIFSFRPGYLSGTLDNVSGGTGAFIDTLALFRPGDPTPGVFTRLQAGAFDNVRNIEVLRLDSVQLDVTVSQQLAGSSQRGYLSILGSSGADRVSAQPTDSSRGPVTTPIYFQSNGGADTFIGGDGRDRAIFSSTATGGVTLNGGRGFDTIVSTANGLLDLNSFASIRNFEGAELRGASGGIVLTDSLYSPNVARPFEVRSYGNHSVDASALVDTAHGVRAYIGDGTDTVLGGASATTVELNPGDLDPTDTLTAGSGFFDVLNFSGAVQVAAADLAGVSGFETVNIPGDGASLTLDTGAAQRLSSSETIGVFGGTGNQTLDTSANADSGHFIYFNAGPGTDIFRGGQEVSIWVSDANQIDATDIFDGGVGGAGDFVQIGGFNQSVGPDAFANFTNIDGFQVFGVGVNVTVNAGQSNTADPFITGVFLYNSNNSFDASAVSGDQFFFGADNGFLNTYFGTQGADIFIYGPDNGNALNGGLGLDQLQLSGAFSGDLSEVAANSSSIESIYLNDGAPSTLSIDAADIPGLSSTHYLIVGASPFEVANGLNDTVVTSNDSWTLVATGLTQSQAESIAGFTGSVWYLGDSFSQYESNGETLFVEESLDRSGLNAGPAYTLLVTTLDDELAGTSDQAIETADGGGLSLREAIAIANSRPESQDVIAFDPSLAGGTIFLTAGGSVATPNAIDANELRISSNVTIDGDIDGDNVADITIHARDFSRAFHIVSAFPPGFDGPVTQVTLDGLFITNGYLASESGGGISVEGATELTLRNAFVTNNYSGNGGGGLYVAPSAVAVIENSTFDHNLSGTRGGAVLNDGVLTATGTQFTHNQAVFEGGALSNAASATLRNSSLTDNGTTDGVGGAIAISGASGDRTGASAHLALIDSTVGLNAGSFGGGIYVFSGSQLDAVNSTIASNQALYDGGGLYIANAAEASLTNVSVVSNVASGSYGAIAAQGTLILDSSTVTANYETFSGSIFAEFDPNSRITNSIILGNAHDSDPQFPTTQTGVNIYNGFVHGGIHDGTFVTPDDVFATADINAFSGVYGGVAADNGGAVATVALLEGGLAQDAGDASVLPLDRYDLNQNGSTSDALPVDARGFGRVAGDGLDLGAYELQPIIVATSLPSPAVQAEPSVASYRPAPQVAALQALAGDLAAQHSTLDAALSNAGFGAAAASVEPFAAATAMNGFVGHSAIEHVVTQIA